MSALQGKIDAIPYWYHKIEMPTGETTPGWAPNNPDRYCIPEDLSGMRVLDIGAWDGYWTWEALKRGATEVVAIDDFSDSCGLTEAERSGKWETFDICREAFGFTEKLPNGNNWENPRTNQRVSRLELSVYNIKGLGEFDIVFFFGTLYHLKHPLLALEKISEICNGSIYIETASLDEYSPYQGGIGHGFNQGETVMEFYPTNQYGYNESNWWTPTLQCLGSMLHAVGFKGIEAWPFNESPQSLPECRGFVSGTKDPEKYPALHPDDLGTIIAQKPLKIAAVMSVPRLGFSDNMNCTFAVLSKLGIPLINVQGAFWGQCLERGMKQVIDDGADAVLTIDYDTVYQKEDLEALIQLMYDNPDAAAIVPIQTARGQNQILSSFKTKTGQMRGKIDLEEFRSKDTSKIATGHFGLSLFRTEDLLELPSPWFEAKPNSDSQWGPGRIDEDINFWKSLEAIKKTVLLANRVVVGHLELLCSLPDENLQPAIHIPPTDYFENGKPENVWK